MTSNRKRAVFAMGLGAGVGMLRRSVANSRRRRLAGQVVLITGGSRGFGLALAREFASLHCRLALCARDADELETAKKSLSRRGNEVLAIRCDISDPDAVSAMVREVLDRYGQIDILVNNAGEILVSPLEDLDIADFERAMAVMFWGTVYTTLAVLPSMKKRAYGRLVNITSIGGRVSVPHLLSYSCAKAAAVAFSDGIRHEVRKYGIHATTVIPGLMRTGSHTNALFKGNRRAESSWFGTAASLPLLTLSAESAARRTVDAVCAGKAKKILGAPAEILATVQTLLPEFTAEALRLSNSLLPEGSSDNSMQAGHEIEKSHGWLYHSLTTLGKRAGRRLNQPV